jgi:hypothetical protein
MLPKKAVHDLLARHKDRNVPINHSKTQFTWAGFHCNCENLVVESPFISNHFYPAVSFLLEIRQEFTASLVRLKSSFNQDENLRGPPIV